MGLEIILKYMPEIRNKEDNVKKLTRIVYYDGVKRLQITTSNELEYMQKIAYILRG